MTLYDCMPFSAAFSAITGTKHVHAVAGPEAGRHTATRIAMECVMRNRGRPPG